MSRRTAEDTAGPALAAAAEDAGCRVDAMEVVPDDYALIEDRLNHFVDLGCNLVFTTGGTGLTPDDITPEATRAVIDREAPGFAEAMRVEGMKQTPLGMLTRGISGIAGQTLIIPALITNTLPLGTAAALPNATAATTPTTTLVSP